MHKGDQNDPRVAVIEVIPEEVRYWLSTSNIVTKTADIVASAVFGKVAAPGELRTLSNDEVCLSITAVCWWLTCPSDSTYSGPPPQVNGNRNTNFFIFLTLLSSNRIKGQINLGINIIIGMAIPIAGFQEATPKYS